MLWNMILIQILHGRLSIRCHGVILMLLRHVFSHCWRGKCLETQQSVSVGDDESRVKHIKEGGGSGRGRDRGRQNWKWSLRMKRAGETEIGGRTEYRMRRERKREREIQNEPDDTFCLFFTTFNLDLRTHMISTITCPLNLRASIGVPQGCRVWPSAWSSPHL